MGQVSIWCIKFVGSLVMSRHTVIPPPAVLVKCMSTSSQTGEARGTSMRQADLTESDCSYCDINTLEDIRGSLKYDRNFHDGW